MKRPALGEPEGALQLSEKAFKEGDAEAELARADPLLELLCTFTAVDKARRWKDNMKHKAGKDNNFEIQEWLKKDIPN